MTLFRSSARTRGSRIGRAPTSRSAWSTCCSTRPRVTSRLASSDRKSTRLNSSHTEIYTLSLHDALPIFCEDAWVANRPGTDLALRVVDVLLNPSASHFAFGKFRSEEHTSELQSHRDLHSFPT